MSPALAGGFLTTAPQGKSLLSIFSSAYLPLIYLWRNVYSNHCPFKKWGYLSFYDLCYKRLILTTVEIVCTKNTNYFWKCKKIFKKIFLILTIFIFQFFIFKIFIYFIYLFSLYFLAVSGLSCGTRDLCCSVACGIFPDRGSNPCPLHW